MQRVLFACLLFLNGVISVHANLEMTSNKKSEFSSLTSCKLSTVLRDMIHQESVLRLSMVQKIQGLAMDALDNKNNSLTLQKKLSEITTELLSTAAKDEVMKAENALLKQELNTFKEAINHDKNLTMQNIQRLAEKMEDENSKFRQEIRILNTANQRVDEENSKLRQELSILSATNQRVGEENLKQELKYLTTMSLYNKQNIQNLNDMNETISKHNDAFTLQFQMINGSLQDHDLQLQNISTQLLSVRLNYLYKNCMEILQNDAGSIGKDGVYSINVNDEKRKVYCDMTTDGGGWTVIQKRQDGSTDFYKTWAEYKKGFGDPSKNYWIGNNAIHFLTKTNQELRVELLSFADEKAYAHYSTFQVGDESSKYRLTVSGYSGTAGNSLEYHNGQKFTTWDQNNDGGSSRNCAVQYHGAWWYKSCHQSNLNGRYTESARYGTQYSVWYQWKSTYVALKNTAMMIRAKT